MTELPEPPLDGIKQVWQSEDGNVTLSSFEGGIAHGRADKGPCYKISDKAGNYITLSDENLRALSFEVEHEHR